MAKERLMVSIKDEFDWEMILSYLSREKNEVMYQIVGRKVQRAFKVEERIILCELAYEQSLGHISIELLNYPNYTEGEAVAVQEFVSDWFDVSTELQEFYSLGAKDEVLKEVVKKFQGLRLVGMPDFYEAITWGILGQQINLTYTYTLKRRFTETFGEKISYQGRTYWIYPTAEKVAQVSLTELQRLKMTIKKSEYLIDISQKIQSGEISKEYYLQFTTVASAEKELIKLRGIGPWTANYVLMRCLRMGSAFPLADIGLLNGIKQIRGLSEKPSTDYLKELQKNWGNWSSYATFYIWRLLY